MDYSSDPSDNMHPTTGKHTAGDAGAGIPATVDRPEHMNTVYDELLEVISHYGLTPAEGVFTQVRQAVQAALSASQLAVDNAIINGGCQVAQRPAVSLAAAWAIGETDRVAMKADGTITAGSIDSAETTLLGGTGYAAQASGVTLTGSGAVYFGYRIESRDVQRFIDQPGMFRCRVRHDVGTAVDYTVTINKADAKNNFSAVTQIATSAAATSVATGTDTVLSLAVADMASCGNGVEIIVKADCGAVTTKNFYITELELRAATELSPFRLPFFQNELLLASRYYSKSYVYGTDPGAVTGVGRVWHEEVTIANTSQFGQVTFPTPMRGVPTMQSYSDVTGVAGKLRDNQAGGDRNLSSFASVSDKGFAGVTGTTLFTQTGGSSVVSFQWTAEAELF